VRRVRAYVGLGANVGDAEASLARAVHELDARPGIRVVRVSDLYATAPVGVADQPEFRNAAAALDVSGVDDPPSAALDLLVALKSIERTLGRRRRARWGPREVDLDLLVFGRARLSLERPPEGRSLDAAFRSAAGVRLLVVPHPEAGRRLFVLTPLADLAPRLVPPGWTETVASARDRRRSAEGSGSVRRIARWDDASGGWAPLP
jgi:2-amino-4-hydroxy-6-hydroxymethyldihydropteridine diphosphokinase